METWIGELVMNAVAEIQVLSGREVPPVDEEVVPLSDLGEFDSVNATEVCVLLSVRLGVTVAASVFATRRGDPLSIRGIAHEIAERYGSKLERLATAGGKA